VLRNRFSMYPVVFFDDDAGGAGGAGAANQQSDEKNKQAELDRQFAERAKRAEEAATKKALEALGVNSFEDAKALIEAQRKADADRKTETEKLADEAQKAKAAAEKIKADADAQIAEMRTRILNSEIKILASKPVADKDGKVTRAAFRAEALDDLLLLIDRTGITETEGKFTGIDKALADLAKNKPWMLAAENNEQGKRKIGSPSAAGGKRFAENEEDEPLITSL